MTQAENYQILFDGGYKRQAEESAENMSVWKTQDWEKEISVFGFADGSAVFSSGSEFRVASEDEISAYKE